MDSLSDCQIDGSDMALAHTLNTKIQGQFMKSLRLQQKNGCRFFKLCLSFLQSRFSCSCNIQQLLEEEVLSRGHKFCTDHYLPFNARHTLLVYWRNVILFSRLCSVFLCTHNLTPYLIMSFFQDMPWCIQPIILDDSLESNMPNDFNEFYTWTNMHFLSQYPSPCDKVQH